MLFVAFSSSCDLPTAAAHPGAAYHSGRLILQ